MTSLMTGAMIRLTAPLVLAVLAAVILPPQASAQKAEPHAPAAKPKLQQSPVPKPADATVSAAPAGTSREPDLAYAAFEHGQYLTAFGRATKRVEDKSDPKSMTLLGELYANGYGVVQDDAKAAEWYKFAADRGDANAMFALAMFRLTGRAGPRDRDAGAKWLAAAAKLGHRTAAYDLALLYMEGELFPRDLNRAAELLRVAAQAGSPEAQYALGTFYKEGRGVPQDMGIAVKLWAAAALADNVDAQVEYAIALYNGEGVERNEAAAAIMFRKAATRGSAIAQDRLARILAAGRGVPANAIEATKWHLISKAGGETNLTLDDYVNRLDANTRAEGEKAAKPWLDALGKEAPRQEAPPKAKP
jgi:TPR repeat protein